MRTNGWVVLAMVLGLTPVGVWAAPGASEFSAAAEAEVRGSEMFAFDQAAWHATDRFQADILKRAGGLEALMRRGFKGYIVEPGRDGRLLATFFAELNGVRFALARYTVAGTAVLDGGFVELDGQQSLSLLAERMIDARQKAIAAMQAPEHGLCSNTPPNSLVLPPDDDGVIRVYIMTSTTSPDVYPAGGHYRFDFDEDGKLVAERRFMKTCFPLAHGATDKGRPEIVFLTHVLDPQPTEIHAFISRNISIPLGVVTVANRHIWAVTNGSIQYVQDVEPTDTPS